MGGVGLSEHAAGHHVPASLQDATMHQKEAPTRHCIQLNNIVSTAGACRWRICNSIWYNLKKKGFAMHNGW